MIMKKMKRYVVFHEVVDSKPNRPFELLRVIAIYYDKESAEKKAADLNEHKQFKYEHYIARYYEFETRERKSWRFSM